MFPQDAPSGSHDWAEKVADSPTVHMSSFEERLGRIMFVGRCARHERPFLAPLYKFLTMHPRNAVRRVPPYVLFYLEVFGWRDLEEETLQVRNEDLDCRVYSTRGRASQ